MRLKYVSLAEALTFAAGKTVALSFRPHEEDHDRLLAEARRHFGASEEWEDYEAVRFTDGTGLVVTGAGVGGWSEHTPESQIIVNLCAVEDWQ